MTPLALFGTFGIQELLLLLAILVFMFGARKIPEIAKGLGEGIRGFRSSLRGGGEADSDTKETNDTAKSSEH